MNNQLSSIHDTYHVSHFQQQSKTADSIKIARALNKYYRLNIIFQAINISCSIVIVIRGRMIISYQLIYQLTKLIDILLN
jgi:hypothetical protein